MRVFLGGRASDVEVPAVAMGVVSSSLAAADFARKNGHPIHPSKRSVQPAESVVCTYDMAPITSVTLINSLANSCNVNL